MKAIVKAKADVGLEMQEVEKPQIKPNEVLIRILKTAICGTDVSIYKWSPWAEKNVPVPLTIGHEFMGVIEEIGSDVIGYSIGQRVSGEGHLTCGKCKHCREGLRHFCPNTRGVGYHVNGCFAEYMALHEENVFPLPDDVSDNIGAIFDPYGNATYTALTCDLVGEDILITGAGPIGCMAAAICKKAGARSVTITDPNPNRLELAKIMGATHVVNIKESSLDKNKYFHAGLEMSGHPDGFNTLINHVEMGGNIALLGILPPETVIDWDQVIFKCLTIKGIWGREIFATWHKMTGLIQGGLDLNPVITHQFKADDFEKGFEVMLSGQCGKVILDWSNT